MKTLLIRGRVTGQKEMKLETFVREQMTDPIPSSTRKVYEDQQESIDCLGQVLARLITFLANGGGDIRDPVVLGQILTGHNDALAAIHLLGTTGDDDDIPF